jgi:anaerobic dimethyl sulfoxide reductase subunit B
MNKYIVFHYPERCIKCWSCEVACKQWHGIKAGTVKLRRVEEITSGTYPDVERTFKSVSCLHCPKPRCIEVCPQGAITKRPEDGIVVVDREKCIGCKLCYDACPVHAPQYDEDGLMSKCDLCLERLAKGEVPVCVATCPTGALKWGELAEMLKKK